MGECYGFQNATGVYSFETELNDTYNASISYTNISCNININYTSNSSNKLFNNSSNSSNDNYNYTSNIYNLNSNDSNATTSNVSNIYYNGSLIDSNLLWYKYELFKTQLEVGNQKVLLTGMSLTDSLMQITLTSHTATLADHGGSITNIQNNHYNKTAVNDLTSNSSNNAYSNSSNVSFSYSYNSSNSLIDFSSNNSNDLYRTNSNSSNYLFDYTCNSSNSLLDYSSNNSNTLFGSNSNSSNFLFDYSSNSSNFLFDFCSNNSNTSSNTSNSLFGTNSNSSNSLFDYSSNSSNFLFEFCSNNSNTSSNTSNVLFGTNSNSSNFLFDNGSNSSNFLFDFASNSSNSLFGLSSNNSNDLYDTNRNSSNSLFDYGFNSSNSLFGLSSNNSNISFSYGSNSSNLLFDLSSNNSNNLYGTNSNSSNSLFAYTCNSSNLLFDFSSNNSNTLYGTNSNSSNSLFAYTCNTSNSLFGLSSNNSNNLYGTNSNSSNSLFAYSCNTSNSLFGSSSNNSNDLYKNNSNSSNDVIKYYSNADYIYKNNDVKFNCNVIIEPNASLIMKYNNEGTWFVDNGLNSYFNISASKIIQPNNQVLVRPFITHYNRMFKTGTNTALKFTTYGDGNNAKNSGSYILLDSGGNPTPGFENTGTISFNISSTITDGDTNRFFITPSASVFNNNVGIGNSTPANKLDVSGNINSSGEYLKSGINISNIFPTSNVLSNTSNSLFSYSFDTSNNNFLYSYNSSNDCINYGYSKAQINNSINTNLLLVGKTTASSPQSILEVSDNIEVLNRPSGDIIGLNAGNNNYIRLEGSEQTNISANKSVNITSINNSINLSASSINLTGTTNVEKLFIGNPVFTNTIVELGSNLRIFKNNILPNNLYGDVVSIGAGDGLTSTGLSLSESGAAFLYSNKGSVYLTSITEDATITGRNIYLKGNIQASGKIAKKSPIFFTTNRTFTLNSTTYSAYDIDLDLYTKKELLDGFSHRHFRVRLFFSNGRLDFQFTPTTYQIYMTSYNSLSIKAYSSRYRESELDQPDGIGYFLYRNSIDRLTFCASTFLFGNSVKVYCVFEDLL